MIIELIRKEFIARRDKSNKSLFSATLSYLLKAIILVGFVALECFIAISLDKKITKYSPYGTYDFLVFFLFVALIIGIGYTCVSARGVIFDNKDGEIILRLPVSSTDVVVSKIIYLYIKDILLELLIATPLLICFGAMRDLRAKYYIFSIIYPLLISVFSVGIGLLLSVPYQFIYKLIKQSDIAQFIIASVLVILLCFLYRFILNMFLVALSDSSVGGVFSDDFINTIHNLSKGFIPVRNLSLIALSKDNLGQNILIILGSLVLSITLGIIVASVVYTKLMRNGFEKQKKNKNASKPFKIVSPSKSLIKKEITLLFKDETNMFSYTSLLIMAPFLTYVVLSSLNGIVFEELQFYAAYFPELVSAINLAVILLFAGIINSSASLSMSREGKCIQIVKYTPIPVMKQIVCKLTIPVIFSETSFMITLFVLAVSGSASWQVLLSSFAIGSMMILWSNAFGLYADMHDKSDSKGKLGVWTSLVPVILPLILLASHFLLTTYTTMSVGVVYLLEIIAVAVCFSPFFIGINKRYKKVFGRMEARV